MSRTGNGPAALPMESAVWLSHVMSDETPLYAGASDIAFRPDSRMASGDSANTSRMTLTSHSGTHVDAPLHFIAGGRAVEEFTPEEWIFRNPLLLSVPAEPGRLIQPEHLPLGEGVPPETDLVLVATGFEALRGGETYWKNGPGLSPDLAQHLKSAFPKLRALGVDSISISSLHHREEGRKAHREFLGRGIRIFEDMALSAIPTGHRPTTVVALPLRFQGGDGSPCTIFGFVRPEESPTRSGS